MKKILLIALTVVLSMNMFSQSYYYYSKTEYTYGPYYFDQSMGLVQGILNQRRIDKEKAAYAEKMRKKTTEMKAYYESMEEYPEVVIDGWHEVTLVVGESFIDNRKVFVENNKIKEVVWDNWMPEEITFSGPIKKGKSAIQYKNPTVNLEGLVTVYFMNAIADPSGTTTKPNEPAAVTFWTKKRNYQKLSVSVNDQLFGPFQVKTDKESLEIPNCLDFDQITVYLKPNVDHYFKSMKTSVYSFNSLKKITAKGTKFKLASGECKVIEITKKN